MTGEKMKIYLIDFENVKSKGLDGIDKLQETDSVIIFFSENSDTLSFEMHQKVLSSKADIEYFKVSVGGKNALDFQLSTLLGYMVAKEIYSHIFVISNDRGFDFLHAFWGGNYIETPSTMVYRTKTISGALEYEKTLEAPAEEAEMQTAELSEGESDQVAEAENNAEAESADIEPAVVVKSTKQPESPNKKKKTSSKKVQSFDEMFTGLIDGACDKKEYARIKELMLESETKEEFHNTLAKIYKQQGSDIYKALKTKYLRLKERYALENPIEQTLSETGSQQDIEIEVPDMLTQLLADICTSKDEIDRVRSCMNSTKNKKQLYISMVKEFQKKKGCEYYNALKPHYNELSKQIQEC